MSFMVEGAWNYCPHCGTKIAFSAVQCPSCGAPTGRGAAQPERSPKSYGAAVALCGVFGTMGIHHFYLGNMLHGIFDLGLFLLTITFWINFALTDNPAAAIAAVVLMCIDGLHTLIVFIRLIIGKEHDSEGRPVLPAV